MKFRLWLTILSCIGIVFSSKALSQTQIATVASILDNPVEGQEVTLQGKIIAQQPGETDYIFTDGTNKITIQLQEADFPYNPDTTVEISGVIDFESQHPEEVAKDPTPEKIQINVDRLQVVDANN
ncbi:MAG: NirD/YgiW/YdeI family stress tolerance protein [Pleurocapsa sp. MO_226.B13]|nr:NirD/YgiW/YdeI family stress tolerance protein [Pleurocapsa sp. MO_226.B13]